MPISPEELAERNRHRVLPVLAVVGVFCVYAYLLTHIHEPLGLPAPQDLAASVGLTPDHVFDSDRNVESNLWLAKTPNKLTGFDWDDERLVLFASILGAFFCAYFLPFAWKQASMALWFLAAFLALYGSQTTMLFLASHLLLYLFFHLQAPQRTLVASACAASFASVWIEHTDLSKTSGAVSVLIAGWLGGHFDRYVLLPILNRKAIASWVRGISVHAPLFLGCAAAFWEGQGADEFKLPIGILLFFWQWHRLLVFHADFKDGLVPENLSVSSYLAVFMTPALLTNWTYSPYVGQAYAYQQKRFYKTDKNQIVWSGVRILLLVLFYLVACDWTVENIIAWAKDQGVRIHMFTYRLLSEHMKGEEVSQLSVLGTTMLYQLRVLFVFGAVCHFRVGVFRILGYQMEPQYDKPWMATNFVSFWRRWAYHYREFVVRVFYYPVFLRVFKKHPMLRVFCATLVATSIGNHIWGHVPFRMLKSGFEWDNLVMILRAWPYYLLLGLGISVTQIYLLKRPRRRKPWTLDYRLPLDVLCAYMTVQAYALIHIFARPAKSGTVQDSLELFLIAFGIRI